MLLARSGEARRQGTAAAASFTARPWWRRTVLRAWRRRERAEEREVASASEEQRAPGARFSCTEVGRGGKRGGTQAPRGGKALFIMSATFKNSRLVQKCQNTRLNLHILASLSPKPFSFGTRGSNKCCRATGNLQNFQHQHRLKLHRFQTMRHQSTLHEN